MINVFGLAHRATNAVNPPITAILKTSDGVIENEDYRTTPNDIEVLVSIKVQALSSNDIEHIQDLNQQSDIRVVYIKGGIKGLNRALNIGGDMLYFYGSDWLVTQVLEEWGDGQWSKLAVTRQIPQRQAAR